MTMSMNIKKWKWWIIGFIIGQAAILWHKDKNLQKKVHKASGPAQKAKAFFEGWVWANKEMMEEVKNFDYEGTWDDVKVWFQKEVEMIEDKMKEFEEKVMEWKDKANDMAHEKAEEIGAMIQDHIADVQEKMKGKRDEANDKYQIEEKVVMLKKQYDSLKKQLQK